VSSGKYQVCFLWDEHLASSDIMCPLILDEVGSFCKDYQPDPFNYVEFQDKFIINIIDCIKKIGH